MCGGCLHILREHNAYGNFDSGKNVLENPHNTEKKEQ